MILITDIWSILTYITRAIRPTRRTLYTIPPPMLLSVYGGGVRHYPLVLQTNPSGSGRFHGINLQSCPGGDVNTTLSAAKYFGLYQIPPSLIFPENLCCSRSAVVRHDGHPVNHKMCLAPRRGASRVMTECNGIIFKNNFQLTSEQPTNYCNPAPLSIGPHPVRVPPKTALARATCPLRTHSNGISNPCGVVNAPEKKRASKMLHSRRYG